jgi:transposase InsO family protein
MTKIFIRNFSLIGIGNKNPEFISSNFVFVAHLENASIKTFLICFIDDASRVVPHGAFYAADDTPNLIDCFQTALYKRGVPKAVYVDNGSNYSSKEFAMICTRLATVLIHTPVRDGAAKGKIERFFRIAYELHDYAEKVLARLVPDDSFLPVIFAAGKDDDWTDPRTWYRANPNLGISKKLDYMQRECQRAQWPIHNAICKEVARVVGPGAGGASAEELQGAVRRAGGAHTDVD